MHAVVAGGKRVVGGQHYAGLRVCGGEGHRALIAGVDVAGGIQSRNRAVERRARDSGRRSLDA